MILLNYLVSSCQMYLVIRKANILGCISNAINQDHIIIIMKTMPLTLEKVENICEGKRISSIKLQTQ